MRWSKYFIPTLREVPADAEVVSHRLILRAGLVRQLSAGLYSYLPLAQRSVIKISNIIREEMAAAGAQEFFLPALNPAELWQESGRWSLMGPNMFRLKDRKGADLCLGMTHEEVITDIARRELRSYKQLPQVWYQIQTKFRDEARPKSGLLRVRQFTMKDAYSFDLDQAGLDRSFEDQRRAYCRIFSRCGLDYVVVEADSGAMGGSASNEFMVCTDAGEDIVVSCPRCQYAANLEKAVSRISQVDDGVDDQPAVKFPTPGVRTIEDLVNFPGGATADRQIKTLVFVAATERGGESESTPVLALLRGDHSLSEAKLSNAIVGAMAGQRSREGRELVNVRQAHSEEIFDLLGAHPGSLGAVGVKGPIIIADEALRGRRNMTTGANEDDHHLRGVSVERDLESVFWAELRNVEAGEACPRCDGQLQVAKALEVGHIFKLGTKYSVAMGANVLNAEGREVPLIMGCYGIGVERIFAAAIERSHDDAGIIFPISIAPFQIVLSPLNTKDTEVVNLAEHLYQELTAAGIEVLYDDRDERAGVKLNDADLIGIPFQIRIGPKRLREGKVEFYDRATREAEEVDADSTIETALSRVRAAIRALSEVAVD